MGENQHQPRERRPAPDARKPVPSVKTFMPESWEAQYRRMMRAYDRIEARPERPDEHEDALLCFFMHAWHLKDWIEADESVSATARGAVETEAFKRPDLVRARDVANGAKHRVLTGHHHGGERASKTLNLYLDGGTPGACVRYRFADGHEEDGMVLAHMTKGAWDALLVELGLLPGVASAVTEAEGHPQEQRPQ